MSAEFTVKHVATRQSLPAALKVGRAYFVEDEGGIVINHGTKTVTYGEKLYWTEDEA